MICIKCDEEIGYVYVLTPDGIVCHGCISAYLRQNDRQDSFELM